ncbi:MAG: hypothetical protein LQ345_006796 [Seirophora villosa]|nr:MAG: hypothetical protein LQ345_006796 [Seirophora villosa]
MLVSWLTLLLQVLYLSRSTAYARTLDPAGVSVDKRVFRTTEVQDSGFPPNAPKGLTSPAGFLAIPGNPFQLLFTFGAPRDARLVNRVLKLTRDDLTEIIDVDESGDNYIQWPGKTLGGVDDLRVYGRPKDRHFYSASYTYRQARQVVDLLERCGIAAGHPQEMWANVLMGKKEVGYIWIARPVFGQLSVS